MKIDFSKQILKLDGQPLIQEERDEQGKIVRSEILLLKEVSTNALLAPNRAPDAGDGSEAVKKFALAMDIYKATGPLEVKVEDAALLKGAIAKLYAPLVVGRAFELIEGKSGK